MILLEIPPVAIFYGGGLMVFGFLAVNNLYLLFTHQIPDVNNDVIIVVIMWSIVFLLLLYLPYWLFGSTKAKRENFHKGLQWHLDVTNLEEKIVLFKQLALFDVLLICGFSLAGLLIYYNVT